MSTRRIPLRLPPALLFFLLLLLLLSRSLSRATGRAAPAVPPPPPFRVVLNDAAFRPHETDLMKEFIAASPAFKLVDVVTTRNRYPGLACDVVSRAYQFSFALKPDWSAPSRFPAPLSSRSRSATEYPLPNSV